MTVDKNVLKSIELKTLEWWISRSMLDLLFFLISRLNYACSPLVNNLQIILLIEKFFKHFTLEWWISKLMLDFLFFLISRLNYACSPLVINLQIN